MNFLNRLHLLSSFKFDSYIFSEASLLGILFNNALQDITTTITITITVTMTRTIILHLALLFHEHGTRPSYLLSSLTSIPYLSQTTPL